MPIIFIRTMTGERVTLRDVDLNTSMEIVANRVSNHQGWVSCRLVLCGMHIPPQTTLGETSWHLHPCIHAIDNAAVADAAVDTGAIASPG